MRDSTASDLARLVLRVSIAGMMLLHGLAKLTSGIAGIKGAVVAHGLPTFVAYGVYLGEVVAPVLVVLGAFTRPAAVVIAIDMVVAVWLRHPADIVQRSRTGGWAVEIEALYFAGAIAIALLGAGRFAVMGRGRWN